MSRQPSFGRLIAESLADQWVDVRTLTIRKLVFLTFFWGSLLLAGLIIIRLTQSSIAAAPYLRLGAVLFLILLTASWIAIAVKQTESELIDRSSARHQLAMFIAMLPTLLITALLTWTTISLMFTILQQPLRPIIGDYASCVVSGGLIFESNPAQCLTTTNTFTDPRGVQ